MATVVAPHTPDFGSLDKAHADFHADQFQEKRKSLLSELRCLSGLPEILGSLRQDTLYRLVLPGGRLLQQGKDRLFRGVFYGGQGIEKHARFAAVGPSLMGAAKAMGSQVLLVSIAMQLNRIEGMLKALSSEMHRDRIAELLSGVDQFEHAMLMRNPAHRNHAIMNAVQTLQIGLRKSIAELRARIAEAPDTEDTFLEHFQYLLSRDSKTDCAARTMGLAQESFQAVLIGIRSLAECYAALDEPDAARTTLRRYLTMVEECKIPVAAQKARLVEFSGDVAPQAAWEKFADLRPMLTERLELLSTSKAGEEQAAIEIEFKPSELQGASHGDVP